MRLCLGGPGVLSVDEALKLAAVEEDAATLGALVDGDATSLLGAHGAMALGADEIAHISTLREAMGIRNPGPGGAEIGRVDV